MGKKYHDASGKFVVEEAVDALEEDLLGGAPPPHPVLQPELVGP